jgi:hypothetical protein
MQKIDLDALRFCILGLETTINRNRKSIDSHKPNIYLSMDPSVFVQGYLYAFNCELLMKYFLFKNNIEFQQCDDLEKLFKSLPADKKSEIENSFENFENDICKYSKYFTSQRYLYENQTSGEISIDIKFLYDFRCSLHKITPEIHQVKRSTVPKPSPAA